LYSSLALVGGGKKIAKLDGEECHSFFVSEDDDDDDDDDEVEEEEEVEGGNQAKLE
jgi:hypothetical protein